MSNIVNDHKTQVEWKIPLIIAINFFSSKNSNEKRILCIKNIEIVICNETDEIIEELYNFLLQKCQKGLEELMKGSELVFDIVDLLYYQLHKISWNRDGSYIASPQWLKKSNNKS